MNPTAPVVEHVTFRLIPGADVDAFRSAAAATLAILAEDPACTGRLLACGDDGLWTDVVRWTSRDAAMAAAARLMDDPRAAPFLAAIDPESIDMRHATLVLARD